MNVARVLGQLGRRAVHLTHAGGEGRKLFLSLAAADGVVVEAPDSESDVRTCYTLLDLGKGSTTEIVEEPAPVGAATESAVRAAFDRLLPDADCLIVSGTRAPGYSESLYADFTGSAKRAGKKIILDIRGRDLLACLPAGPDFVKPNLAEFASTFLGSGEISEHVRDEALLEVAAKKAEELFDRYGVMCVLTRGALPALYFDGRRMRMSAPSPVKARNTTGCGDAFTAGFAAAWGDRGFPDYGDGGFVSCLEEAVEEGHRCAAMNAESPRPGRIVGK